MAMQLAKAVTGARIIAMDVNDDKLQVAKQSGADLIINSKKEDAVKAVMELTGNLGADAVIDFVNASNTVETDMQILRRRARVILVGLFGGALQLNLVTMRHQRVDRKSTRLNSSHLGISYAVFCLKKKKKKKNRMYDDKQVRRINI